MSFRIWRYWHKRACIHDCRHFSHKRYKNFMCEIQRLSFKQHAIKNTTSYIHHIHHSLPCTPICDACACNLAKFLDTSVCGGSWCLDLRLSPFLVKFTQILESILLDNPHKAVVLSVGCASFSSTLFPSTQLSVNMLGYSTLWTASFFGNECLWLCGKHKAKICHGPAGVPRLATRCLCV